MKGDRCVLVLALVISAARGAIREEVDLGGGLTVVVPTYNERENVAPLLSRLEQVAEAMDGDLEVIIVEC